MCQEECCAIMNECGLFQPAYVDPSTGYRYYTLEQLPRLNRLLALKDLGFTLEQIAPMLDHDLPAAQSQEMLLLKQAEIQRHVQMEQALSDEQSVAHLNFLVGTGHETTSSLSAWTVYLLAQHPDYLARVLQEQEQLLPPGTQPTLEVLKRMTVLEWALNETERLYPP